MDAPNDKKQQLLLRFDFARKQNEKLMEEIEQYAQTTNRYDTDFMQGYSFQTGLNLLKQ